jgi:hypothetical protein
MATRTVTGILYHADGATVWAGASVVITPKFAGAYESADVTNASGVFTITVPLPDSGNGTYVARFPDDISLSFIMGQGSTTYDISTLIATITAATPVSQAQTLTDGATVSWNTNLGRFGVLTLGGNRTMAAPTNLVAGGVYTLKLIQDATGSRLVTWNAVFKWLNGAAPILSTDIAAVDVIRFVSDGTSLWGVPTLAADSQSQVLTDAATIAWNTNLGSMGVVTLGADRIMGAPTNLQAGKTYHLKVIQDATGTRLITWNAVFKWLNGAAPILSTVATSVDVIRFVSDGTNLWGVPTLAIDKQSQVLTDQATIAWDTHLGSTGIVTLGGNRTMAAPTNLQAGKVYHLKIIQDATGTRLITWDAVFKWAGGTAPTLTATLAHIDIIRFVSDGTNLYGTAILDVS